MDISSGIIHFLVFIGGLGVFIYGMKLMSEGLLKITGRGLRKLFSYLTSNPFLGVVTGFIITALIQSSSASTVMVVSLVNTSLLSLSQSVSLILGANIGTTITGWIVSLAGFKVPTMNLALIVMGFALPMIFSKINKWKSTAEFFVGFSFMLLGLSFMKDAVPDLSQDAEILSFLRFYKITIWTTFLAVILGALLTIVVQSSSVSIGMIQILTAQGIIPIEFAVAMLLGSNIGTTLTPNIASIVASRNAKRVARIHSLINIIGAVWAIFVMKHLLQAVDLFCLNVFDLPYSIFSENPVERGAIMPIALATFHSGFNIINALILMAFTPVLVKLSGFLVSKTESAFEITKMDKNYIIETPELEVLEAKSELLRLSKLIKGIFNKVHGAFLHQQVEQQFLDQINEEISNVKSKESSLLSYLTKVYKESPSAETSEILLSMTKIASELNEIGITSYNLAELVYNKKKNRTLLDEQIFRNLGKIFEQLAATFDQIITDINKNSQSKVETYLILEEKINQLNNHIRMLQLSQEKPTEVEHELLIGDITNTLSLVSRYLFNISSILTNKKEDVW